MNDSTTYKHIVLGGGCAGLSICYYLLQQGETEPILLLEQRVHYDEDRTWCFWDVEPTPFTHLSTKIWHNWEVLTHENSIVQSSETCSYCHLQSKVFYDTILEHLRSFSNFTLQLGEKAYDCSEQSDEVRVTTDRGVYSAQYVVDSRSLSPTEGLVQQAKQSSQWIPQQFLGQRIVVNQPVFTSSTCTLMDFRVSQQHGIHFVYVLPQSSTEALVENVYIGYARTPEAQHHTEIQAYLSQIYGLKQEEWRVVGEEMGYIPMTDFHFPRREGQRIFFIGTRGGETRAASGYTFVRIQRTARQLASLLLDKQNIPLHNGVSKLELSKHRYRWLDSIFLRFMAAYPTRCPDLFYQMFAGTSGNLLARFMMDRSSIWDDLRLIAALPKRPFIGIFLQVMVESWLPRSVPKAQSKIPLSI